MEAKNFIDVWPNIYLFDLLRYLIPLFDVLGNCQKWIDASLHPKNDAKI